VLLNTIAIPSQFLGLHEFYTMSFTTASAVMMLVNVIYYAKQDPKVSAIY